MNHEIKTSWKGKMHFDALVNGHTVMMDAPERSGGENQAPTPKPLLLVALSGCTGMDVIALMKKASKEATALDIDVVGELGKGTPIEYANMHIIYRFEGPAEHREAALDAVDQSQEKYCGVSHLLKKAIPITWEIWYNGQQIFSNQS